MLYTGRTGYIKLGANNLAHMSSWSLELSIDIGEVISYGEDYKEKIPGVKDWTASADGVVDFDTASGQRELVTAFEAGTLMECAFGLDTTTSFVGTAYIESLSVDSSADGHVEMSISLSGSKGVTLELPDSV